MRPACPRQTSSMSAFVTYNGRPPPHPSGSVSSLPYALTCVAQLLRNSAYGSERSDRCVRWLAVGPKECAIAVRRTAGEYSGFLVLRIQHQEFFRRSGKLALLSVTKRRMLTRERDRTESMLPAIGSLCRWKQSQLCVMRSLP